MLEIAIAQKMIYQQRRYPSDEEAHPAKSVLGDIGVVLLSIQSERGVSPGNGIYIRLTIFPTARSSQKAGFPSTRSQCSSAAKRLSSYSEEGGMNSRFSQYLTAIGQDGQQSSLLLTGVHGSHKSRRRGDMSPFSAHMHQRNPFPTSRIFPGGHHR